MNFDVLYKIKANLLTLYANLIGEKFYGYVCDPRTEYRIDLLSDYADIVRRQIVRDRYCSPAKDKGPCCNKKGLGACIDDISLLSAKINETKIHPGLDIKINTDDQWVIDNPQCASFDSYRRYARDLCKTLNLTFDLVRHDDRDQAMCDLTFELTRDSIPCDLMVMLSLTKSVCDLGIHLEVDKSECLAQWEVLIEKNPDCDLSLSVLMECKRNNISFDIIEFLISRGLSIEIIDGEIEIVGVLRSYRYRDLSLYNKLGDPKLQSEYWNNPKAFIKKYLNEYNLNNTIIEKII